MPTIISALLEAIEKSQLEVKPANCTLVDDLYPLTSLIIDHSHEPPRLFLQCADHKHEITDDLEVLRIDPSTIDLRSRNEPMAAPSPKDVLEALGHDGYREPDLATIEAAPTSVLSVDEANAGFDQVTTT